MFERVALSKENARLSMRRRELSQQVRRAENGHIEIVRLFEGKSRQDGNHQPAAFKATPMDRKRGSSLARLQQRVYQVWTQGTGNNTPMGFARFRLARHPKLWMRTILRQNDRLLGNSVPAAGNGSGLAFAV